MVTSQGVVEMLVQELVGVVLVDTAEIFWQARAAWNLIIRYSFLHFARI